MTDTEKALRLMRALRGALSVEWCDCEPCKAKMVALRAALDAADAAQTETLGTCAGTCEAYLAGEDEHTCSPACADDGCRFAEKAQPAPTAAPATAQAAAPMIWRRDERGHQYADAGAGHFNLFAQDGGGWRLNLTQHRIATEAEAKARACALVTTGGGVPLAAVEAQQAAARTETRGIFGLGTCHHKHGSHSLDACTQEKHGYLWRPAHDGLAARTETRRQEVIRCINEDGPDADLGCAPPEACAPWPCRGVCKGAPQLADESHRGGEPHRRRPHGGIGAPPGCVMWEVTEPCPAHAKK